MKVSEELKAKIEAELERREDDEERHSLRLSRAYWMKHNCKDYDNGNGICAWCGRALIDCEQDIKIEYKQKTFTREEISRAIKITLAKLYEDCASYPYDSLYMEKDLHHETVTSALINLGFLLDLDDLILDKYGDIILYPSKDNKRID